VLAVALVLGAAVVVVSRLHRPTDEALDHPVNPVGDEQSRNQVIESAKQVVSLNALQPTSAGYLLMSCKNETDPPYQGAIYLTFALPAGARPETYFPAVATTLTKHGWTQAAPPANRVFGSTLSKDAVTVTVYRDSDDPDHQDLGIARIYGECRNVNDHRADRTGWVDIIDELKAP
jgi:hypothetical protein